MSAVAPIDPRLSRRTGYILLVVLFILLIALLVMLVLLLQKPESTAQQPVAGIRVLRVLYGPGTGDKPFFNKPMGAAFGRYGRIYVADSGNNRVVVFDARGRFLFSFGGFGVGKPAKGGTFSWTPGRMNYPTDVAVDDDGTVYVADFHNDQIQVFDHNGRFLKVFPNRDKKVGKGASGKGGTGIAVTSVAVSDGRVYATDAYQILAFDLNGDLVSQHGKPGSGPHDLDHPNGIALGPNSAVVVSDSDHNRVVGFTPAGRRMWDVGQTFGAQTTAESRVLEVPRGIVAREDGTFIVADAMASHLVELSQTGKLLGTYGRYGQAPGELNFPTDVDARGSTLLVAEKGGDRVQVLLLEK